MSNIIKLEIDWADWENTLPDTKDAEVLAQAIEAEIKNLVQDGIYPASVLFVQYIAGGLPGSLNPAMVQVSVLEEEALAFLTAYCGGDEEQAEFELSQRVIS